MTKRLHYVFIHRKYMAHRHKEKLISWVAWHLPRSLVMWCFIRVFAHGTTGKYGHTNADEVRAMTLAKRWENRKNG